MQPTYFPIIAAILATVGLLAGQGNERARRPEGSTNLPWIFAVVAIALLAFVAKVAPVESIVGAFATAYCGILLFSPRLQVAGALVFVTFLLGAAYLIPSLGSSVTSGLAIGASIGAVFALGSQSSSPAIVVLIFEIVFISNRLGQGLPANGLLFGSGLLVSTAGAVLVSALLNRHGSDFLKKFRSLLIFVIMLGASWIIAKRWLDSNESWIVLGLSTISALVVHYLLPEDEESGNLRMGIATIVWCALATFAFGIQKSAGIGEALAAAGLTLVALGNFRAMQSLVPLLAIAFYRVFRDLYPSAAKAIDIGQHYAIIGVTIGAVAAILPLEWIQQHMWPEGRKALAGLTVWALLLPIIPCLVATMLGEKGVTGFLVGLGLAALLAGFRSQRAIGVISTVSALGGATLIGYGRMDKLMELSRDEKIHYFSYSAAGLVAIGAVLSWLGSSSKTKEQAV